MARAGVQRPGGTACAGVGRGARGMGGEWSRVSSSGLNHRLHDYARFIVYLRHPRRLLLQNSSITCCRCAVNPHCPAPFLVR